MLQKDGIEQLLTQCHLLRQRQGCIVEFQLPQKLIHYSTTRRISATASSHWDVDGVVRSQDLVEQLGLFVQWIVHLNGAVVLLARNHCAHSLKQRPDFFVVFSNFLGLGCRASCP